MFESVYLGFIMARPIEDLHHPDVPHDTRRLPFSHLRVCGIATYFMDPRGHLTIVKTSINTERPFISQLKEIAARIRT